MSEGPKKSRKKGVLQLTRLQRLMDVIFALVIWRIFMILPRPEDNPEWGSVLEMISDDWTPFLIGILALVIVIIYWMQNNTLFGLLQRTDAKHTAISIFQMFFLLLFLYAIGAGLQLGEGTDQRIFESLTAMLVGLASAAGWRYAIHERRLLDPEVPEEEVDLVSRQILAEPATAALTIPFTFIGPWMWEISWFLYPLIRRLLSWRPRAT
jgi:uncharacterized membrane protein